MQEMTHQLQDLAQKMEADLRDNILPFWSTKAVDTLNGGFYGRVDYRGKAIPKAAKGSILHARILWTFSTAYALYGDSNYKIMADRAFTYFVEYFVDRTYGGVYWTVDYLGNPLETHKHVYAQAFAIYGLTAYAQACNSTKAKDLATTLFYWIESHAHDNKYLGYHEAYTRDGNLLDDVRLSEKDRNYPKSMNTHLHVLEAYTQMYLAWPEQKLGQRLEELIHLFMGQMYDASENNLINFSTSSWEAESSMVSYGHNIEAAWLVCEAVSALPFEESLKLSCKEWALKLTDRVLKEGFDTDGGLFNELKENKKLDRKKAWWPQAEAIVGLIHAWELKPDQAYLSQALKTWTFVENQLIDRTFGEWHEEIQENGQLRLMDKIREWKCPYHNARAAMELVIRTQKVLKSQEV